MIDSAGHLGMDIAVVLLLIGAVRWFRVPEGARMGNLVAGLAILIAGALVLFRQPVRSPALVVATLAAGTVLGAIVARRATMTQVPAMIALQHGVGGCAVFLVSLVELSRTATEAASFNKLSAIVGLVVGAATFGASMLAAAKLAGLIRQTPSRITGHNWILLAAAVVILVVCGVTQYASGRTLLVWSLLLVMLSMLLSVVFAIRVGGADMPVLISVLNATSGIAAAFCGVAVQNRLLIACGATVASSGSLLTGAMCKAMNRNLLNVFVGIRPGPGTPIPSQPADAPTPAPEPPSPATGETLAPFERAVRALAAAQKIIVVPGYGMALAQAQFAVRDLAARLDKTALSVKFAIHPVAGRMPGHMNVVLAEAELDYDKFFDIDAINPEFNDADVALVVGACDVINPAAIEQEGTPISGMPILRAMDARAIIVCNMDDKPGYSGVQNPIYRMPKTVMLLGDAKQTIERLLEALQKS